MPISTECDSGLVEQIEGLALRASRQPLLQDQHRRYIYNDAAKTYEQIERYVAQTGKVANVECLAAVVLEEALRRNNASGEWMTVTFNQAGASFSPDDRERLDGYEYSRVLSPEWALIADRNGKLSSHVEFLRLLQRLARNMEDAPRLIRAFRSIDAARVTKIASAPVLQNGKASVGLAVELTAKLTGGGEATALQELPEGLTFTCSFSRGGSASYTLHADLLAELARVGEKDELRFGFLVPDLAELMCDAWEDEVKLFRELTKSLPRLLVLENF